MLFIDRRLCLSALVVTLLVGCVSIDSRIEHEVADSEATAVVSATFSNWARYQTSGAGVIAINNLADILRVPWRKADDVLVSLKEGDLTLTFLTDEKAVGLRTYRKQDLSIGSDGKIELPTNRALGAGAALIGYQTNTVTLFVNNRGDLVAVHSGGGVGTLALVIPIGVYGRHMAIFPRKR